MSTTKQVLVIQGSSLCNVALTLRSLYCVAHSYPQYRFIYLIKPSIAGLLIDSPSNLEVMTIATKKGHFGPMVIQRLARLLFKQRFDLVLDFDRSFYARILSFYVSLRMKTKRIAVKRYRTGKESSRTRSFSLPIPFVYRNYAREQIDNTFARALLTPKIACPPLSPKLELSFLQEASPSLPANVPLIGFAPFGKDEHPTNARIVQATEFVGEILSKFPTVVVVYITHPSITQKIPCNTSRISCVPINLLFPIELDLLQRLTLLIGASSSLLFEAELVGTKVSLYPFEDDNNTSMLTNIITTINETIHPQNEQVQSNEHPY